MQDVSLAATALARGEIVAYPTETFYGLGVAARHPEALASLLTLKGRDAEKGLSLLVVGEEMLMEVVAEVSPRARALIEAHWPGPLTLALPARAGLPPALVRDGFVAVRESPHPLARALVSALGAPLTATSANPAGAAPPTTAEGVRGYFGERLFVLDGGETPGGLPSTLARVRGDEVEILRAGALKL
jgi:L-threonylcarbamoyladenylate synthase